MKVSITAASVAVAVSVAIALPVGASLAGGGAESTNIVLSRTNAYIEGSVIGSSTNTVGVRSM